MSDLDISCLMCGHLLSPWQTDSHTHKPAPEELHVSGRIAVPNLGWFCSEECAGQFERAHDVRFQRDALGRVNYYP